MSIAPSMRSIHLLIIMKRSEWRSAKSAVSFRKVEGTFMTKGVKLWNDFLLRWYSYETQTLVGSWRLEPLGDPVR